MKLFKKNQIIIYVIALMLVTAGYLNYTTTNDMNSIMQTSSREEEITEMANIGDAQLVSSNVSDENNLSNNQNTNNQITDNEDSTNIEDKESNTIKEENKNEEVKENNSNNASVTTSSNNNSKEVELKVK